MVKTISDAPELALQSSSPKVSVLGEAPSPVVFVGGPVSVPSTPVTTVLSTPGTASSPPASPLTSTPPHEPIPLRDHDGRFAHLGEDLRAKALLIASRETVEHVCHIFNYMAAQLLSPVRCGGAGPGPAVTLLSALDARINQLGGNLVKQEKEDKERKFAVSVAQLRKRVLLTQLIGLYIAESEVCHIRLSRCVSVQACLHSLSNPGTALGEGLCQGVDMSTASRII